MKLTKKQQEIYQILENNELPLNAEELFEKVEKSEMNLSTVYRALEKFFKLGLINRNYLNNTAYYYLSSREHHHFILCEECGKLMPFDCKLESIIKKIEVDSGFMINHHDLNLYGLCEACQIKN